VERNANEIRIMDLKSGSTFDADGEIKPNIALQLLIYGVMAQTLDPGALIFLVINNGTEHPGSFRPRNPGADERMAMFDGEFTGPRDDRIC
jgi:hypothetical protein